LGIGAVIFDFGNVLIGWNPENLYRKLIPDPVFRREFLERICDPEWNRQHDLGRPWAEGIAERVARYPEHADLIRAYRDRFQETLTGLVPEGNALLRQVRAAGLPCYGLTNWSGETYDETAPAMPFLPELEHVAVSGHLKMAKPAPEIYLHLLEIIGLPPESCAFIDDSMANIEAAERLGMRGVHFRNDGTTAARLRQAGAVF
jgi:2-haloacid dehalogenase